MFTRVQPQTVTVHDGDEIPFDGTVVEGFALVNECTVTGVSTPVLIEDQQGRNHVIAGGLVVEGTLKIRSEK